jgi:phage recombination protein Bet
MVVKKETKQELAKKGQEVGTNFRSGQEIAVRERKENEALARVTKYSPEVIRLVKDTVARGATTEELQLFLYTAARRGLDPLAKQLIFTKRWSSQLGRDVMTLITSIDGFRAIAERSRKYAGQDEPVFEEGRDGKYPVKATVAVYRRDTPNGERYPIKASAYWSEYLPDEKHDFMWKKMPHVMLAKVAEAQALRKAFPEDLSGLYTPEEMAQSGIGPEDQSSASNRQLKMGPEELLLPFGTSVGQDVADAAPLGGLDSEEEWQELGKTEFADTKKQLVPADYYVSPQGEMAQLHVEQGIAEAERLADEGKLKDGIPIPNKLLVKEESWKLPAASEKQVDEYLKFCGDATLRSLAFKLVNDFGAKHFEGLADRDAEKVLVELRKASTLPRTKAQTQQPKPAEQKPAPAAKESSGQMISGIQLNAIKQLVADPAKAKVASEYLEETGAAKFDVLTHEEAQELIRKLRAVKA